MRRAALLLVAAVSLLAAGCATETAPRPDAAAIGPIAPIIPVVPQRPRGQVATASWYGPGFNGRRTATGEVFHQNELTAASKTLPLGSHAKVTNMGNGRSVVVRINDRGPYVSGRSLDLSRAAAQRIGLINDGVATVRVTPVAAARSEVDAETGDSSPKVRQSPAPPGESSYHLISTSYHPGYRHIRRAELSQLP
jgi:rare lipoprotein A